MVETGGAGDGDMMCADTKVADTGDADLKGRQSFGREERNMVTGKVVVVVVLGAEG